MSKTIEQMLDEGGPCRITIGVNDVGAQANVQEPGSTGWNCFNAPTASEALRRALTNRPMFRPAFMTPAAQSAVALTTEVRDVPTPPVQRRVVIRRPDTKPPAPVPTARHIIRR